MAITYPLDLPGAQISGVAFRLIRAQAMSASPFSYAQSVYDWLGARWEADISLSPMKASQADAWEAWLLSLNGQVGTFWLGDPLRAAPRGTQTADVTITSALLPGARSVPVVMGAGATLKRGDVIQFGSRLHKIVEDAEADGSGSADLSIEPGLRKAVALASTAIVSGARGTFRLATPDVEWASKPGGFRLMRFSALEAL